MALVPLSATHVRLLKGVPFNNDYKHTRWMANRPEQTAYFLAKPHLFTSQSMNFQRIEGHTFVDVKQHIDTLHSINYMMFQNEHLKDKWFYAFVTKLEFKNISNTRVYFELDVLQTWRFEMNFKPSYVVREHRPLWNRDGTPIINTIDEGLDYGQEMDSQLMSRVRGNVGEYKWFVIVTKHPLEVEGTEKKTKSSVIGTPQPLSYYVVPFADDNTSPDVQVNGEQVIFNPLANVDGNESGSGLIDKLYEDENAVNNIVSLYVTEYPGFDVSLTQYDGYDTIVFPNSGNAKVESVNLGDTNARLLKVKKIARFHEYEQQISPDKYGSFTKPIESKLLMYPYVQIIFTDFRGNQATFRPEYIKGKPLKVLMKGSLGTSNYVSYGIKNYNSEDVTHEALRSNESALLNTTPNDVPIITDMLSSYLQGNRNSIQNQKDMINLNKMTSVLSAGIGMSASVGNPIGMASSSVQMVKGGASGSLQKQRILAKQSDLDNTPSNLTKMGSNTAYDFGNKYNGMFIVRKEIKPEYRAMLSDYFNMYGYKINRVKKPAFRTRTNWNYIQTSDCVITGDFNNEDIQDLKSVFDNGITLWHTEDVGNYALDNGVRN